jgi:hypothetical protein
MCALRNDAHIFFCKWNNNMTEPILYILARQDIPQMNAGKLAAQACHAQSILSELISARRMEICLADDDEETTDYEAYTRANHRYNNDVEIVTAYDTWLGGERRFGTTIVLAVTMEAIAEIALRFDTRDSLCPFGVVNDPTYPMFSATGYQFTAPMLTCAYLFIPTHAHAAKLHLQDYKLYP